MGVATVLAISAGVAVAAGAATAYVNKKASDDAIASQQKALEKQRKTLYGGLDPDYVNQIALKADTERAKQRIALQKEIDPELAEVRSIGKQQLLDDVKRDPASRASNRVADQLFRENIQADPELEKIKDTLIADAQKELSLGARLPPEFQAELVRSGLNQGAAAGVGLDARTIGGNVGRVLGSAGIALQRNREDQAMKMAAAAQGIQGQRANILNSIFPTVKTAEDSATARAANFFNLANANLPEAGISGSDAAKLQVARVKGKADLQSQAGQLDAAKAIANGQFNAAMIGTAAGAVSAGAGAYGAYAGMGGGGANAGQLVANGGVSPGSFNQSSAALLAAPRQTSGLMTDGLTPAQRALLAGVA